MADISQRILNQMRQLILSGQLKPGQKLSEVPLAEQLGSSRTPVRSALASLAQEGLLEQRHKRGYHVRMLSYTELIGAVEVRAVLEGLAARQAVERGFPQSDLDALQQLLDAGDALMESGRINADDIAEYTGLNSRFHQIIIDCSQNPALKQALARNEHLPFASANAIRFDENNLQREFTRFFLANQQHHLIVDAIKRGQSARAEALMREHALVAMRFYEDRLGEPGLEVLSVQPGGQASTQPISSVRPSAADTTASVTIPFSDTST